MEILYKNNWNLKLTKWMIKIYSEAHISSITIEKYTFQVFSNASQNIIIFLFST